MSVRIEFYCTGRGSHPARTRGWLRGHPKNRHTFYFTPWASAGDAGRSVPHPHTGEARTRWSQPVGDGLRMPECPMSDCTPTPWLSTKSLRLLLASDVRRVDMSKLDRVLAS